MRKALLCLITLLTIQLTAQTNNHPSILIHSGDELRIKQSIENSPSMAVLHNIIIKESDVMLSLPCLKYEKIGKRLLDVSRECLRRVFYLSYSYQTTGDEKYAKRAEKEMLTVCAFPDWNPTHFLDVAEMTLGVSIGYDWTYNYLPQTSRNTISQAIINNGIKPSMDSKYNYWLQGSSNWNQVCNAGIIFGAIAVRDIEPELSKTIIDRSLKSITIPMKEYEPDGTFPEGFMYWGYGTTFNVMLISAAEKLLGNDLFPISKMPGFIRSASYILNMVGPSSKVFNFSDSFNQTGLNPAMFWFAQKTKDVGLLWTEKKYISSGNTGLKTDRLLPLSLIWGAGLDLKAAIEPTSNFWLGQGVAPVCLMRTSWSDKNAIFLGFKSGSPSTGHGHMDVGSFVMDANGVQWASDFGAQSYYSLESKGIDLWNNKQDSQRWKVFRYNNFTHNTLTFNDSLQRVSGVCKMDAWSDYQNKLFVTSDITPVYAGQVKKVVRTAAIINKSFVSIKDVIETLSAPTKVRWTLLTGAMPILNQEKNQIELTKSGKKLLIRINSPAKIILKTWPTKSPNEYDEPNPYTYLVGFEVQLPENSKIVLDVSLIPQE